MPRTHAPDSCKTIGAHIRTRRMMLGMTQAQLGDEVSITPQQVHKYESGANGVSAARLCEIAAALHVEPVELLVPINASPISTSKKRWFMVAEMFRSMPRNRQDAVLSVMRALTPK